MIEAVAKENQFSLDTPINQLSEENLRVILYGTNGHEIRVEFVGRNGRKSSFNTPFEGVVGNLEQRYRETQSEYVRMRISEFMGIKQCHLPRQAPAQRSSRGIGRGCQYH